MTPSQGGPFPPTLREGRQCRHFQNLWEWRQLKVDERSCLGRPKSKWLQLQIFLVFGDAGSICGPPGNQWQWQQAAVTVEETPRDPRARVKHSLPARYGARGSGSPLGGVLSCMNNVVRVPGQPGMGTVC